MHLKIKHKKQNKRNIKKEFHQSKYLNKISKLLFKEFVIFCPFCFGFLQ